VSVGNKGTFCEAQKAVECVCSRHLTLIHGSLSNYTVQATVLQVQYDLLLGKSERDTMEFVTVTRSPVK
jgi:hypothetical protein